MVTLLGSGSIAYDIQQIASQSMELSLVGPLLGRLDDLHRLGEAIQSFDRMTDYRVGLGEKHEHTRRPCNSSGGS